MKTSPHLRTTTVFASLCVLCAVAVSVIAMAQEPSILPLAPESREQVIAGAFIDALEKQHVLRPTLGQSHSKEAFRIYIKKLDPQKLYFYQSDIDEFKAKYESQLIELLKQSPAEVQPAFEIYNRYLERLRERGEMIQKILATPMDFTIDEEYVFDSPKDFTLDEETIKAKGLQTFPQTTEEAYDRLRKRLKSELLALRVEVVDDRDPVERLQSRYAGLQRRMLYERHFENAETLRTVRLKANDRTMTLFLTAIAESFDSHSSYISLPSSPFFWDTMVKPSQGIGATLGTEDGYIFVRELVRGGTADKSGELLPGDKIRGVGQGKDGKIEDVVYYDILDVVQLIRGPKETVVRLEILPGGRGPAKIIELVRDRITLDDGSAQSEIFEVGKKAEGIPYRVGFIVLPAFYVDMEALRNMETARWSWWREPDPPRSAITDVRKILQNFVAENVDAVVLDLRDNNGGSLTEAISLSGLFLRAGVVVQTKNDEPQPQPRGNINVNAEWSGPFVVLTSKYSASASEFVAGAIQDYNRGLIVGDSSTLGKGMAQTLSDLSRQFGQGVKPLGTAKVTTDGVYRLGGISVQGTGIETDIVLPSLSEVMKKTDAEELDNVLTLPLIPPADFTPTPFVTPPIIAELRKRSAARVGKSEEFAKLQEQIALYRESEARRATPLNEAKYREEMQRFRTDEWERETRRDRFSGENRIKRDFYVDEVLAIAVDYVEVARKRYVEAARKR